MRKSPNFDEIVVREFGFLVDEYGFRLAKCQLETRGYEIVYLSSSVGIKIVYEYREAYIFIMLYRLIDGVLVEDPGTISDDTILNGFGLDDLLAIRNPNAMIKPAYEYGSDSEYYNPVDGLRRYVSRFASNLKEYARDILSGDFEVFKKLNDVVKQRAAGL